MDKIKLEVLGLSYSQTQAGAYALILSIENDTQRIPIIIGGFEAQSIAIKLEDLKPPRPLTHDIFIDFSENFGISLIEVFIYRLEEGIFYSKLYFKKEGEEIKTIEARTSDAVALALRFNAPIYTIPEIVEKAGIILNFAEETSEDYKEQNDSSSGLIEDFSKYSEDELSCMMTRYIDNEEYEKASMIRDELSRRKEI